MIAEYYRCQGANKKIVIQKVPCDSIDDNENDYVKKRLQSVSKNEAPEKENDNDNKTKTEIIIEKYSGLDPHGYKTATKMYTTTQTMNYDGEAAKLIAAITNALNTGLSLESITIWDNLKKLNPYRQTKQVQDVLTEWITKSNHANKRSMQQESHSLVLFKQGNTQYRQGDFQAASATYMAVLTISPKHHNARNNLALSQMHLNNDLTAQLEFELIRLIDDTYIPACINLVVLYERNGQSQKAQVLLKDIMKKSPDISQALFNQAWYENIQCNLEGADSLLRKISGRNITKYYDFYKLNHKQLTASKDMGTITRIKGGADDNNAKTTCGQAIKK
ncbi:MAG: hypothetical protein HQL04_04755 [Nitrospirae bacterium]|nr:hypothetical protein [Nitrospirota bacterium]